MLATSLPNTSGATDHQNTKLIFNIVFAAMVAAALTLYGTNFADSNDLRWLWVMGLAGLSLLQMSSQAFLRQKMSFDWLELLLLGFVAYVALSLAWSPDYLAGLALLSKLGLLAVIFLCLKNVGNDKLFNWLCSAVTASVVIVLWMQFLKVTGSIAWSGYGNENFLTEFLILAVPFIAALAFIYRDMAVRAAVLAVLIVDLGYLIFCAKQNRISGHCRSCNRHHRRLGLAAFPQTDCHRCAGRGRCDCGSHELFLGRGSRIPCFNLSPSCAHY